MARVDWRYDRRCEERQYSHGAGALRRETNVRREARCEERCTESGVERAVWRGVVREVREERREAG